MSTSTYYSSPTDVMPKAKQAAMRALELDPNLATAHELLGMVTLFFDWDWAGAEKEFKKALEINPSLPEVHLGYANYLATLGRFDEAIANAHEADNLDPLSPAGRHESLWIYFFSGRFPEAVEQCRQVSELEPDSGIPYAVLAVSYAYLGKRPEAIQAVDRATQLSNAPIVLSTSGTALARLGDSSGSTKLLDKAVAQANDRYVCRFNVAAGYALLGEKERAFDSLEQAFRQRSD